MAVAYIALFISQLRTTVLSLCFLISIGFPWSLLLLHFFFHLFFWFQTNPSSIPLPSFPSKYHKLVVQAGNSNHLWLHYFLTRLPLFFLFGLPSLVCLSSDPIFQSIILPTFGRVSLKWKSNCITVLLIKRLAPNSHTH